MTNKSRKAFTLIEILAAVMLTGTLTTLALVPVVYTVRDVVETQNQYADVSALSRTMNFIIRDLNSAMRLSSNVVMIVDHEAMGGNDDDILMIMTTSTTVQNMPSGTVIYKIEEGGMLHGNVMPGLYRFFIAGQLPNTIKYDNLNAADDYAQLVLPGVDNFCVEIPTGSHEDDRTKEYSGQLPKGLYIKIARNSSQNLQTSMNNNADDKNKKFNEIEAYIPLL